MDKKLLIQIPCYNEENSLPITVNSIPSKIKNISVIDILIIDDGSVDRTVEVAKTLKVKYIISNAKNEGLAKTFLNGVDFFLTKNYDFLVNLDADNQYKADQIDRLLNPLIHDQNIDCVIGERKIYSFKIFNLIKSILQLTGSFFVSFLIGTKIKDVTTGFRSYRRKVLENFKIYNEFSYTLESLLFLTYKKKKLFSVEVDVNKEVLRESRLFKSNFDYIFKQFPVIIKSFAMYFPFKFFFFLSCLFLFPSIFFIIRFLINFIIRPEISSNIQSLILSASMLIISFFMILFGVISELILKNREIMENIENKITKDNKINSYRIIIE